MNLNYIGNKRNFILNVILIISIILGFLIRLKGLGKWPFAIDEYYIIESAKNILKYGLPKFKYGGYYDRGLIYQYMISGLLLTGLKAEFACRIITVICNILVIHPLYLLAKKISGKTVAVALIVVFCFSVWEVEFARFARMYAPFQLVFIWYLYYLYKNLIENNERALKWMFILSALSIFIYEASIFLVLLNFLPFIWNKDMGIVSIKKIHFRNINFRALAIAFIIFAAAYFYLHIDFRNLGSNNPLPPGIHLNYESQGTFRHPIILLGTLINNTVWLLFFILPLVLTFIVSYKYLKDDRFSFNEKLSILVLIVLSILNLFGLSVFLLTCFFLLEWIKIKRIKIFIKAGFIITLNYIFWTIYAVFTSTWHSFFSNEQISGLKESIKFVWKEFINYPNIYETFHLFYTTIPHLTLIVIVLLTTGIILITNKNQKFLFFIFISLLLLIMFLNLYYFDTRYFFFLYPVVLLLSITVLKKIVESILSIDYLKNIVFALFLIGFLFLSEDFNLNHLYNIDSKKITFRENFSLAEKVHYYPRWDTRTPAEIINKNIKNNDIVITNKQLNSIYLNRLNYVYIDYRNSDFAGIYVDDGKKERWTNTNLIYSDKELINLLENYNSTKWLIINTLWGTGYLKESNFFNEFRKYEIYSNKDRSAILYKIPPRPFKN